MTEKNDIQGGDRTHTEADRLTLTQLKEAVVGHKTFGMYQVDRCECSGCARIRINNFWNKTEIGA
jgi:hypothetical protein